MEKKRKSITRSSSALKAKESGRYHHGNLREALVLAAEHQVATSGDIGFNLREIAAATGVTHAAAYRHFSRKLEVLAELARRGFRSLESALDKTAACDRAMPNRLIEMGVEYVRFAITSPGLFRVMFHPSLKPFSAHDGLQEAASAALTALRSQIIKGRRTDQLECQSDLETQTMALWAAIHGQAVLQLDGHLVVPFGVVEKQALNVAREGLSVVIAGLLAHERQ